MNLLQVDYRVSSHPKWKMELELFLDSSSRSALREWSRSASGGREIRWSLPPSSELNGALTASPQQWSFFLKKRPSDNRLLLAHPSAEEWVATLALQTETFQEIDQQLGQESFQGFSLDQICKVSAMSNVHFRFLDSSRSE